uniref:Uncharacterized protein n=1 Tax=Opuntia streptacantha TaxID=393608 RepID=A0A7C9B187_OPUST
MFMTGRGSTMLQQPIILSHLQPVVLGLIDRIIKMLAGSARFWTFTQDLIWNYQPYAAHYLGETQKHCTIFPVQVPCTSRLLYKSTGWFFINARPLMIQINCCKFICINFKV